VPHLGENLNLVPNYGMQARPDNKTSRTPDVLSPSASQDTLPESTLCRGARWSLNHRSAQIGKRSLCRFTQTKCLKGSKPGLQFLEAFFIHSWAIQLPCRLA